MTRGQLKLRVSRILGIALGTSEDAIDEETFLDELANEAVIDVLSRTRVHVHTATVPLDPSTNEFEVDTDIILKLHSIWNGTSVLQEQEKAVVDSFGYYWIGYNRFVVGMVPTGDTQLAIQYTPVPTPMTDDLHDPAAEDYGQIPVVFHRALINYMCWWAADKAGDEQVGRGEKYRVLYEGQDGLGGPGTDLGRIKDATNHRAGGTRIQRYREVNQSDIDSRHWV